MKSARRQLRAHRRAIEQAELRAGGDGPPKRLVGARRAFNLRLAQLRGGDGEEEVKMCAICLDDDDDTEKVRTPCGHTFCRACLKQWLRQQCTCPMCRTDFSEKYPNWLAQNEDLRCGNRLAEENRYAHGGIGAEFGPQAPLSDADAREFYGVRSPGDEPINLAPPIEYVSEEASTFSSTIDVSEEDGVLQLSDEDLDDMLKYDVEDDLFDTADTWEDEIEQAEMEPLLQIIRDRLTTFRTTRARLGRVWDEMDVDLQGFVSRSIDLLVKDLQKIAQRESREISTDEFATALDRLLDPLRLPDGEYDPRRRTPPPPPRLRRS